MYYDLMQISELTTNSPLSEHLRPQDLNDLTLDEKIKSRFNKMIEEGNIKNMLFYGKAGTGKTSTARILAGIAGYDFSSYDMSLNRSIEFLREIVIGSAVTKSLYADKRLLILDEADAMSEANQNSLKVTIEMVADSCKFILITNNPEKIIDPIKSRLINIRFDQTPGDYDSLVSKHTKTVIDKISKLQPDISQEQIYEISKIVKRNFPDYRRIANEIDFELF